MSVYAPNTPTVTELRRLYPVEPEAAATLQVARKTVGSILDQRQPGVVGIIGPCAMTLDRGIIDAEGDRLAAETDVERGLVLAHRMPPWKPRTNAEDWHGLETTYPAAAYGTIVQRAMAAANVAIELGHTSHLIRYSNALTLGWIGSRNAADHALAHAVTVHDPTLPVAIKNDMTGDVEQAVTTTQQLRGLRGADAAPVTVIYRGGSGAQTPNSWELNYRRALDATEGRVIVDTAHGGEMAHDEAGAYGKSVLGQRRCLEHVLEIAQRGEAPVGMLVEASEASSPTDPVMPFSIALEGVRQLHRIAVRALAYAYA